jgi:hypothetical protein
MYVAPGSLEQLSEIISHVVAPAFLLGAMASFVSILTNRISGLQDRIREIGRIEGDGHVNGHTAVDLPHLRHRVKLLHKAFVLTIASGVVTCILIIGAFAVALLGFQHVGFAAVLFMISMVLLFCALLLLSVEVASENGNPLA